MIHIAVAQHRPVVRAGLEALLGAVPDLRIVAAADDAPALVAAYPRLTADVCLLDARLPGGGFALIGQLRALRPTIGLLLLGDAAAPEVLRAVGLGAAGQVPLDVTAAELEQAVRAVAAGGHHLGQAVAGSIGPRLAGTTAGAPHERLSERELDVVTRLAGGTTLVDIGTELGISIRTVSTLRTRAMEKLGLTRNAELTRYAMEHDLLG